ncbi:MAG: PaaI family thioesterase [Acidimicrobiales bacterium]
MTGDASGPGADLHLAPASLTGAGAFVREAGFVPEEISATRVVGHVEIDERHHTPWGIVHGGVYATAIESAASIGASSAVRAAGQVAVGLTNTTHFLRSITHGTAAVEATALNQGRTQQLWQVDVRDERGRLLAHGEVRLQNLTPGG